AEKSRKCLSESRKLLARVNALLSARPAKRTFSKERSPQRNLQQKAMERVFDRGVDEKAESRLIESSRTCLSESRELQMRVDALLSQSAPRSFRKERDSQREALRKAIQTVFDKWSDEKASPLPRSTSMH